MDDVFILNDDPIYFRGRVLRWVMLGLALLLIVVPRIMPIRQDPNRETGNSGSENLQYNAILFFGFVAYACVNAVALLMVRNGSLMGSDVYGIFTDLCPWLLIFVVFVNQMRIKRRPFSWPAVACFIILMSLVGRISGYFLGLHSAAIWVQEILLISWVVSGSIGGCMVTGKGYPPVVGIILAPLLGPLAPLIALFLPMTSKDVGISEFEGTTPR